VIERETLEFKNNQKRFLEKKNEEIETGNKIEKEEKIIELKESLNEVNEEDDILENEYLNFINDDYYKNNMIVDTLDYEDLFIKKYDKFNKDEIVSISPIFKDLIVNMINEYF
jgi:hypothetical protein